MFQKRCDPTSVKQASSMQVFESESHYFFEIFATMYMGPLGFVPASTVKTRKAARKGAQLLFARATGPIH